MSSRLRWVLAQVGTGPSGRVALRRLLDADALPGGGWRRRDQRTWHTGAVAHPQPWQAAARASGSITAWRSFAAGQRWLWIQVTPLAAAADAPVAMAAASDPTSSLKNVRARVRSVDRRDLDPPTVRGADLVTATEETTTGPDPVRTLRCAKAASLVVVCASGPGWQWADVVGIAERQLVQLSS